MTELSSTASAKFEKKDDEPCHFGASAMQEYLMKYKWSPAMEGKGLGGGPSEAAKLPNIKAFG